MQYKVSSAVHTAILFPLHTHVRIITLPDLPHFNTPKRRCWGYFVLHCVNLSSVEFGVGWGGGGNGWAHSKMGGNPDATMYILVMVVIWSSVFRHLSWARENKNSSSCLTHLVSYTF